MGHLKSEAELVNTDLQEATGIVLLDHFQAVLHEARGLAQFHCAMRDLVPNHLRVGREQKDRRKMAEGRREAPWDLGNLPQSGIHSLHGQWLWPTDVGGLYRKWLTTGPFRKDYGSEY